MMRRTQAEILKRLLPPRTDFIIYCGLTPLQEAEYESTADSLRRYDHILYSTVQHCTVQHYDRSVQILIDGDVQYLYLNHVFFQLFDMSMRSYKYSSRSLGITRKDREDFLSSKGLKDIELYQEAEEDVVGAGKGSGSFILPGLQKLRRICNTSDGQPDDVGQAQDKEKDKKEGLGRGKGYGIGKKEVKKDRQQELEYGDCETEDLSESRNVKLEHLESERERVQEIDETTIKTEPSTYILSCPVKVEMSESIKHHKGISNSDSSTTSTEGRGLIGDEDKDGDGDKGRESDRHDRCSNDNLEVESQLIVKVEMDVDKSTEAIQLHTRHEKEEEKEVDVKGNGEVKGDVDEEVVVEERGLSVSSNGRIEFIAPFVFKSIPRPAIDPSLSHQKTVATSCSFNASIESVENTVMAPLKSIPKGPGDGPRGWVVPTKKKLIPVTATATATTAATATAAAVVPFKVPSGLVKRSENDVAGKIEILKSTAQRVVVVKRLHGTDSKHLITAVPVPVEVTAESLLAGSGKLQVNSTSSSFTHYLLTYSFAFLFLTFVPPYYILPCLFYCKFHPSTLYHLDDHLIEIYFPFTLYRIYRRS